MAVAGDLALAAGRLSCDSHATDRDGAMSAARSTLWAGMPIEAASARKSIVGSTMSMAMKRLARADA
jgi:hypothetical protein